MALCGVTMWLTARAPLEQVLLEGMGSGLTTATLGLFGHYHLREARNLAIEAHRIMVSFIQALITVRLPFRCADIICVVLLSTGSRSAVFGYSLPLQLAALRLGNRHKLWLCAVSQCGLLQGRRHRHSR